MASGKETKPVDPGPLVYVRNPLNYNPDVTTKLTGLDCSGDAGRTIASQARDAELGIIMQQFGMTGHVPGSLEMPTYMDFDEVFDYQSALHRVMQAQEAFAAIPSAIRARFDNDPAKFLDFAYNPENAEEMVKLFGPGAGQAVKVPTAEESPPPPEKK